MEGFIVVVDKVEKKTFNNKVSYKLVSKLGDEYTIGKVLNNRVREILPNVAYKLTMDTYNGSDYIKDFVKCIDITPDKLKELSKPVKNQKDISIEAQAAVKCVSYMISAGQFVPEDIKELALNWIRNALMEANK